jgi:hypothetical protein
MSKPEKTGRRAMSGTKAYYLERMPKDLRSKAAKQELEVITDHPIIDVLEKPNSFQHRFQFVYSFVANLCLTGRAYILKDDDGDKPVYYSVPTTWVRPDHTKGPFGGFYVCNPRQVITEQHLVDPAHMLMAYMPNPADPMGCLAPAGSMSAAIRVDDRIQTCQEKFFDNGVFPSVIVTVGKEPRDDVPGGIRPRLTMNQRRQVYSAIQRVMGGIANYGKVGIVDGLIESITKFQNTQPEIGWEKSESTLKTRILSAFGVHPYILGEPVGVGGYAQTYNIEVRFFEQVNIFLSILSTLMTEDQNRDTQEEEKAGKPELPKAKVKTLVWWEECVAKDPSLEASNLKAARQNNDITQNELRAKLLGLPPDEDGNEEEISAAAVPQVVAVMTALAQGGMSEDQAEALFIGMGYSDELAKKLATPPEQPEPPTAPEAPPTGKLPPEFGGEKPTDEEAQGGQAPKESEPGKLPPKPGRRPSKPQNKPESEIEQATLALTLAVKELRRPLDSTVIASQIVASLSK